MQELTLGYTPAIKGGNALEKKGFLTEALSFNCPHCNHSCVVYREGDSYWVE